MPRRAVVLMNLGGPEFARGGAAVSVQSVQRPGDHRLAGAAAAAAGVADRVAPGRDGARRSTPSSAAPRRCSPIPRRRRGRWKRELGAGLSLLYRDALLASADRGGGRRGQGMAAGRDRAVAALSAILDDDDGIVARRLGIDEAKRQGLDVPTDAVRSYPTAAGFIAALAALIADALDEAGAARAGAAVVQRAWAAAEDRAGRRSLSAARSRATAAAVVQALARPGLDWRVCYQSRVGPLAWLGPSVEEELRRAGRDGVAVVVAPISFVSEHSETLVELDRDYRRVAESCGVPAYRRVPTVGHRSALYRRAGRSGARSTAAMPRSDRRAVEHGMTRCPGAPPIPG